MRTGCNTMLHFRTVAGFVFEDGFIARHGADIRHRHLLLSRRCRLRRLSGGRHWHGRGHQQQQPQVCSAYGYFTEVMTPRARGRSRQAWPVTAKRFRPAGERRDPIAKRREPRIIGLAVRVPIEDLLNHDGDLEQRECFVEANRRDVAARTRRVPLHHFVLAEVSRTIGHRRQRVLLPRRRRRRRPVREEDPKVHQRIAERAHFPVEDGDRLSEIERVQQDVIELEIAVDDRWPLGIGGNPRRQPSCERVHFRHRRRSSTGPTARSIRRPGARQIRPACRAPRSERSRHRSRANRPAYRPAPR